MILYKLTDANAKTRPGLANETQWGEGITHEATGTGTELCSDGFIHVYTDPLLAVFMDPAHGNYGSSALLWECESPDAEAGLTNGTKVGRKSLTTLRKIPKPTVTTEQRIAFGILSALAVIDQWESKSFTIWAENWLNATDRTRTAADAAAYATYAAYAANAANAANAAANAAAYTAAYTAANAAAYAARAAAYAADAAAYAADAAAAYAARAAAYTADAAADAGKLIDFVSIAHAAMKY